MKEVGKTESSMGNPCHSTAEKVNRTEKRKKTEVNTNMKL